MKRRAQTDRGGKSRRFVKGEEGVGVMRVMGLCLAVGACLAGAPAWGITVDGVASPGEWDTAAWHFVDADEPVGGDTIPPGYDVTDIYLTGGDAMYFRLDVVSPPVNLFTPRGVYLRYDFAVDEDPGAAYSISFNDGLELPRGQMHVVRFPDGSARDLDHMEYLGTGTFVSGSVLEASFDWLLFPADVVASGTVTLNYQWWLLESGPYTIDDGGEGPVEGTSLIIPEPLTGVGLLMGVGLLARRWVRGVRQGR